MEKQFRLELKIKDELLLRHDQISTILKKELIVAKNIIK